MTRVEGAATLALASPSSAELAKRLTEAKTAANPMARYEKKSVASYFDYYGARAMEFRHDLSSPCFVCMGHA